MPKRVVVCCDGTWNDADAETHIRWIFENCQGEEADPLPQFVGYFAGVGTGPVGKITGGVIGAGLSHNVRKAYRFIQKHWQPDDELFIFGFSRGAYTARSLSGFLHLVGLLDDDDDPHRVDLAYLWYRLSRPPGQPPSPMAGEIGERVKPHIRHPVDITFLGVFDTVGALGVPFRAEELTSGLVANLGAAAGAFLDRHGFGKLGKAIGHLEDAVRRPIEGFHDTGLGAHVRNAYHALAIDERRGPFVPTLWTTVPPRSTVEQAWFAGVHGDVGGNYHEKPDGGKLAAVPLLWMMEKATALGLDLRPDAMEKLRATADPLGPQHESLTERWERLFDILPTPLDEIVRPIGNEARRSLNQPTRFPFVEANETIHPSVRRRLGQMVETRMEGGVRVEPAPYAPRNVPDKL
jgi:uncharacterized protein (DUF2235 family)